MGERERERRHFRADPERSDGNRGLQIPTLAETQCNHMYMHLHNTRFHPFVSYAI